jgi:hypothetical protein
MNAIFDTNTVYYLDSKLSNADFERLIVKITDKQLNIFVSPITVIEMTSRLKKKPSDFAMVKRTIGKLLKLNPIFLPDPEQQLTEYVLNTKVDENEYRHWKEIFYTISIAPSVEILETGFDDLITFTRRAVNLTHIYSFRKTYEEYYVLDMETPLKSIVENFDIKILKRKNIRLSKDRNEDFKKYLGSTNWTDQLKLMLVNRTLQPLPNSKSEMDSIFEKIYYFRKSYEDLFVKIFEEGYIPNIKKKNDYNDWHFNVYFNIGNDFYLVTSERNVVFKELTNKSRCLDLGQLLK